MSRVHKCSVIRAFEKYADPFSREFVPRLSSVIWQVIRHKRFPVRQATQINFLADSLAGLNALKPRRARDIVAEGMAQLCARQKHRTIRREFYIECTCGYEGPTYKGKCPMRDPERAKVESEKFLLALTHR